MLTDLVQIKRQGEKKHVENMSFRRWLKSHTFVERQFRKAAEEVHAAIDCRQCAQCCRVTEVELTERDIEHLAKFLGASKKRFLDEYTMQSDDGALILKRTDADGCVFLSGNDCTVYEARPADCDRFPHLLKGAGSLESKMWKMPDRATYCPIVFNWLEKVKGLTKFTK
ncbi:MAG: YkgJ family cysteine cluster protein [Acidobacteriota bacterium]